MHPPISDRGVLGANRMEQTTEQMIAARRRCREAIKAFERRRVYLTEGERAELKEWRAVARKLDHEIGKRIVQLPLL